MHTGQKIKQARLNRGLTQSALCGNKITRNMLSLIENGLASPSVKTLIYIADKLDIPVGYLISDDSGNSENEYLKLHIIRNVRSAFKRKDYAECINLCESLLTDYDDEINLLLAECYINLAVDAYKSGYFTSAKDNMKKALDASENTMYNTSDIKDKYTLLSVVINDAENQFPPPLRLYMFSGENAVLVMKAYVRASDMISQGEINEARILMEECGISEKSGVFYEHLIIKISMKHENHRAAAEDLISLLKKHGASLSVYMRYKIYDDIEYCCKVTGDFKIAYEYSIKKLELMSLSKK